MRWPAHAGPAGQPVQRRRTGNDAAQLNIRGKSTYGKSDVIMIVDGIERDMSYLSPDEIETFTILKDASATAPYGIRGANGVIIVTTKRGRKGEKPTVDFKASVGVSEPIRYPDYLGSAGYATLYNEAMLNDNPSLDPGSASLFSQETISNFRRAKATTPTAWATTGITSTTHSNRRSSRITAFRYEAAPTAPLFHPRQLLQPGRQLQAFELRQRQQVPAL